MVELRKRKTPPPAPTKPAKKATKPKAAEKKAPPKDEPAAEPESKPEPVPEVKPAKPKSTGPAKEGDQIDLDGFGGEVETNSGDKTSLKELVAKSKAGVVLFTYPKASTPGCTTQVCLFRDSYTPLTATGLDIYGLSKDSPKANTTFKTKQNLPYPLLCDTAATLIAAIGLKNGDKTQRGVFVVTKEGKVLAAEAGGPAQTVAVVRGVVDKMGGADSKGEEKLDKAEERATATEANEANGA
ncbi:AhpC-TSA-domain-containing protein [Myriangium duriaei CBS 260.36]|uniref:thioredoxin-dependent peroxiredoxin n=1 Tax=Myriangium duriaei CBS 260.36 TaxID=1168546 RepID=A0A9P4MJU8_9PEZI|nr:AhpC-TSA-domain-containing protein [Myriangium duriaei CBS 260.36]